MSSGWLFGLSHHRMAVFCACYGRTLSERPCYILPMFFSSFFIPAFVGQTAERIFTKLSHVVDIRHHL